jgi:hypothetical protein
MAHRYPVIAVRRIPSSPEDNTNSLYDKIYDLYKVSIRPWGDDGDPHRIRAYGGPTQQFNPRLIARFGLKQSENSAKGLQLGYIVLLCRLSKILGHARINWHTTLPLPDIVLSN